MGDEVKVILNKKYGIPLIQKGFNIIDIQPSNKGNGDVAFMFEKTEELEQEFSVMINENRFAKQLHGLTLYDIRTLSAYLGGFDISEDDRVRIISILTEIDNDICGYKEPLEEITNNSDSEIMTEEVTEEYEEVDIAQLKQAMSGAKDYSKYDKAFNQAVKR